jgi:hypothetical protein
MDLLEIIIIALLVIILVIVLTGHVIVVTKPVPVPNPAPQPSIGGCAGTRYGCCPYSQAPKLNEIGSNCVKQ